MSKLRFVTKKMKVFIATLQFVSVAASILCLIIFYTQGFNQFIYIALGCVIPVVSLIATFFPLYNAYIDRATDMSIYILTGTEVLTIILFIVSVFLAR